VSGCGRQQGGTGGWTGLTDVGSAGHDPPTREDVRG